MGNHAIVHIELAAEDQAVSAAFYRELFGWQTNHVPAMNYTMFAASGGPGGGFITVGEHGAQVGDIRVYVRADDIDAMLSRVAGLGGKTVMGKSEIPGVGWFGVFTDPGDTTICLFTPLYNDGAEPANPTDGEHPILNVKLAARDQAQSAKFYHELFGWQATHIPDWDYTFFQTPSGPTSGLITANERGVPPGLICIDVKTDDVEATLKRVEALGGKIVHAPQELPNVGWMGGFTDPAGTQIWLFAPKAASQVAAAD